MQLDNKLINEYYEAQKTMIYNRYQGYYVGNLILILH